jgi:hypothetical protein
MVKWVFRALPKTLPLIISTQHPLLGTLHIVLPRLSSELRDRS